MMVKELMRDDVLYCRRGDSLSKAAQLMWEGDVGCLPVADDDMRPVGMITDRDMCMAAYSQGLPLHALLVDGAMAHVVFDCRPDTGLEQAQEIMRQKQVRRLPSSTSPVGWSACSRLTTSPARQCGPAVCRAVP